MSSGQFQYKVATLSFSSQEDDEDIGKAIENFLAKQTEMENFQWSLTSAFSYTVADQVKVICIFETIRNEEG